jgi:NAD(P)-dependent dehydrogenase (short-subunit alcohol dehydrogenase family)
VIVNVSSAASRLGSPGEYVDYAASKGAVDTLTTGLALEVAAEGIRVNAVRPGFIHTDIHATGGDPNRVERLQGNLPMRRGGRPEEVAEAIVWLLSDQASYVTGSFSTSRAASSRGVAMTRGPGQDTTRTSRSPSDRLTPVHRLFGEVTTRTRNPTLEPPADAADRA